MNRTSLALLATAFIQVPVVSWDLTTGEVQTDWPAVAQCAQQQLPSPSDPEWGNAWHEVYTCRGMLVARHAGYIAGQKNPGIEDPYLGAMLKSNPPTPPN